jgi:hypothetical protein
MLRSRTVTARLLTILASGLATFAGLSVARTAPVPVDVLARAGRELWFGTDKNTIGRARIP